MFYFDPMYFVFLGPAILLALFAQIRVKTAFAAGKAHLASSGFSGAETARRILDASGLSNVAVEETTGFLGDHYDPKAKVLRLSCDVYRGNSLSALGVAAHEAGHALQDAERYSMLVARNAIVPMASFGSNASWAFILIGSMLGSMNLLLIGVMLFSLIVLFQVVNLPVEFDASKRAKELLVSRGFISPGEQKVVASVLNAAALTYVAATISAILTLVYYLWRLGIIGGNRDD